MKTQKPGKTSKLELPIALTKMLLDSNSKAITPCIYMPTPAEFEIIDPKNGIIENPKIAIIANMPASIIYQNLLVRNEIELNSTPPQRIGSINATRNAIVNPCKIIPVIVYADVAELL